MSEFTHKAAGVAPNAVPAAAQDTAPAFPTAPEAPFATAPDIAPASAVRGACGRAFEGRDWAVVALALLEALLCSAVFWPADLLRGLMVAGFSGRGLLGWLPLPGVGLSLAMLCCIGALFVAVGRKARLGRTTVPLVVACVAMSLMPAIFADGTLRALNCLVLWPTWTLTAFLVSGMWPACKVSARACRYRSRGAAPRAKRRRRRPSLADAMRRILAAPVILLRVCLWRYRFGRPGRCRKESCCLRPARVDPFGARTSLPVSRASSMFNGGFWTALVAYRAKPAAFPSHTVRNLPTRFKSGRKYTVCNENLAGFTRYVMTSSTFAQVTVFETAQNPLHTVCFSPLFKTRGKFCTVCDGNAAGFARYAMGTAG